jgi:hypothetical protein
MTKLALRVQERAETRREENLGDGWQDVCSVGLAYLVRPDFWVPSFHISFFSLRGYWLEREEFEVKDIWRRE